MKLKYISWLPAVLIMIMIFLFSTNTAEVSDQSSMSISQVVLQAYEQITDDYPEGTTEADLLGIIDHIVRKTAHFIEYALLAAAIAFHGFVMRWKVLHVLLISIVIAGLYAGTDEYHQTFVSGRSGQPSDVLLDTAGAATGALCYTVLWKLSRRWKAGKDRRLTTPL